MRAVSRSAFRTSLLSGLAAALALPACLEGQTVTDTTGPYAGDEIFANSEFERYLRVLQVDGRASLIPWSSRPLARREVADLSVDTVTHPWRVRFGTGSGGIGTLSATLLRSSLELVYNSGFPYGANDGPVWAGRGATTVIRSGFAVTAGPLYLRIAPIAFWVQNAEFQLHPQSEAAEPLRDPARPRSIDRPQRLGENASYRIAPGESTLRLDTRILSAGVSTESLVWGPMWEHPLIMSTNAGGFPHAFIGTPGPADLGIGRIDGKVVWGALSHSDFAFIGPNAESRRTAGLVMVVQPRGLTGLEVGFSRFFHVEGSEYAGLGEFLLLPVQVFLKKGLERDGEDPSDATNQLASAFVRWAFPEGGFEIYGEFAREDHNYDLRDFLLQPDHDSGYGVGFTKVWSRGPERMVAVRGELMNMRPTHLALVRPQVAFYGHSRVTQGHTHNGQVLGSAAGPGGAASAIAVDLYGESGRLGLRWSRELVERATDPARAGEGADVMHALGLDGVLFRQAMEFTGGVAAVYELNRYLADDAINLRIDLGVRARP